MKIALVTITQGGSRLADRLAKGLAPAAAVSHFPFFHGREIGSSPEERGLAEAVRELWPAHDALVFIMAAGLVVRTIAPLLRDKKADPAVVVLDELGSHAVSLLSGHLGGGNELARRVAGILGGRPVITTASDTLGLTALDLWAAERELAPRDHEAMTRASALLVQQGRLAVFSEVPWEGLPPDLERVPAAAAADLIISSRTAWPPEKPVLHPRNLVLGIGCHRGTTPGRLAAVIGDFLSGLHLARAAVRNLATIDLKLNEPGLLALARSWLLPIHFYSRDQLNAVPGLGASAAVLKATGARGVAEPAALLSAGAERLLAEKTKWRDITLAMAETPSPSSAPGRAVRST